MARPPVAWVIAVSGAPVDDRPNGGVRAGR